MFAAQNDEMELLRVFIDFERSLEQALPVVVPNAVARSGNVRQMWREYAAKANVPPEWNNVIMRATDLRNQIAHGRSENLSSEEVTEVAIQLMEVTEALKHPIK
jgi:hypothetical protein